MNWQLRTFLLLAVLAGNAWAADVPAGRIFYAPFDGSLDAAEARGDKRAEADGKTTFAPGRKGQGLVVGDMDGSAGAYYQTAGNIVLERGTVAMWVQPVNWQGDDGLYHNFFSANPGEKGLLMLYKYHSTSWGLTFIVDPDDGPRAKMYCYRSISGWKPGEWHHIACAWTRDEGMALYIDGEPASQIAGTGLTDKPLKPRMRFGTDWQRKGARTVLDEVMIFDRMLAPHEVASLAGKPSQPPPAEEPRDVPGVMLAHAILGHKVLARVYLDCLGDPSADSARLSLTPSGQTKSVAEKTVKLSESLTALELDLKPLPKGVYAAQAAVMSQGTVRAIESLRVSKETDDTWETAARIGKEDKVLPPFAALKLTGNQVECSGPRYEFGDSGLPARLQSRGSEMLAGPIQVLATAGEGAVQFSPEKLKVAEQSDTQAKLSGRLDAAS
ncbi:MAG: LamG domain-containing protein, partial [Planctomycetes bacterium]|nr:LamG domain-containing protein [Planctomycetota bacterium]